MRLLEKYGTMEGAAIALRGRYSRKLEEYCHKRLTKAHTRRYGLFWTNMHYLLGLISTPNRRYDDSVLS